MILMVAVPIQRNNFMGKNLQIFSNIGSQLTGDMGDTKIRPWLRGHRSQDISAEDVDQTLKGSTRGLSKHSKVQ